MRRNSTSHNVTSAMNMDTGQHIANRKKSVATAVQKATKQRNVKAQNTLAVDAREAIKLGFLNVLKELLRAKDWRC